MSILRVSKNTKNCDILNKILSHGDFVNNQFYLKEEINFFMYVQTHTLSEAFILKYATMDFHWQYVFQFQTHLSQSFVEEYAKTICHIKLALLYQKNLNKSFIQKWSSI